MRIINCHLAILKGFWDARAFEGGPTQDPFDHIATYSLGGSGGLAALARLMPAVGGPPDSRRPMAGMEELRQVC